ncbi:alpha-amylase family glycosyl hydrolase [Alkaliphilus transvaalensis]|uniref:alpha-amylase family glycosyl hydrolase n=1 Tax=Alkaliphilus transvaalensis TaxID=114628 RepID=UPI000479CE79|nr:alpha-amylase family glycosyl hydrolase [Alkaliphilus transvaalensis]
MAKSSPMTLRNHVIYSVYVRNHCGVGTFNALLDDLPRIKDLGVDIIWLMPIHPIGVKNKKGSLGCPYAIQNYREINSEYGDLTSFKKLVESIHHLGMKCMIDVVFHHTSPDSDLYHKHPEFFYMKNGRVGNKVGDWYDIIDLDFSNIQLWHELIDTLKYWVSLGVDGFRCDVASLVPIDFWLMAREEVAKIKEDVLWLSETVEPHFVSDVRREGYYAASDSESYQAFDITYDYDGFLYFKNYLEGRNTLEDYLEKIRQQEYIYPNNYAKLRFIENHDQSRIKTLIPNGDLLKIWTAFMYFQKGPVLLYAGQEAQEIHRPSLFDLDPISWDNLNDDFVDYLKNLYKIKQKTIFANGYYHIHRIDKKGVIYATYEINNKILAGIFNVENKAGTIKVELPDGNYTNLVDGSPIMIEKGEIVLKNSAIILEIVSA